MMHMVCNFQLIIPVRTQDIGLQSWERFFFGHPVYHSKANCWSPPMSDSREQTFQKTLHQRPPSSWAMRQWYKMVRSTGSVKRQKKRSERKNISDHHPIIVLQLQDAYPLSRASINVLTCCWTTCWTIVGCRSEMFFISLSFCDLSHIASLRTSLYHCRMAHDDGGFWFKGNCSPSENT